MRVLFTTCHLPFPPISGGRRRELELLKRLARDHEIHLVVVSKTAEQDAANAHEMERYCERVEVFPAEPLDGATAPRQVRRHRCPALARRIAQLLARERFDLVHAEGFYLMQHLPDPCPVPVMLVEQNIEYDLERQRAGRRHALHDMGTLRAELAAWRRSDLLGVLTPEDRDMLVAALPGAHVRLVPDGADHVPAAPAGHVAVDRPDAPLAVFVANFGYAPNVEAATHLCADILPAVREQVPDVNLWLVGTDPPPQVRELAGDGVRVTGRVPDVIPYMDAADVIVCPLRVGGGIKVKAIEALRRGKCVVSTSVGAQGMPPLAARAIAVHDDPGAFAARVVELLRDSDLRERGERASARAGRRLPTWDAAAAALASSYRELLGEERDEIAVSA